MPGKTELPCSALDGADDLVGDVLVNVEAFFCHGRSPLLAGRAIAASWGKMDRDHWVRDQTPRVSAPRCGAELHKPEGCGSEPR